MYMPAACAYMETPMSSTNPMAAIGTPMTQALLAMQTTPMASTARAPRDRPRKRNPNRSPPPGDRPEAGLQDGGGALDRLDRADVLEGEDGDDEERRHRPGQPAGDADETADEAEPLLQHADGRADDGGKDRPAEDHVLAPPGLGQRPADGGRPALDPVGRGETSATLKITVAAVATTDPQARRDNDADTRCAPGPGRSVRQ